MAEKDPHLPTRTNRKVNTSESHIPDQITSLSSSADCMCYIESVKFFFLGSVPRIIPEIRSG